MKFDNLIFYWETKLNYCSIHKAFVKKIIFPTKKSASDFDPAFYGALKICFPRLIAHQDRLNEFITY